jgi:hypothetical protein
MLNGLLPGLQGMGLGASSPLVAPAAPVPAVPEAPAVPHPHPANTNANSIANAFGRMGVAESRDRKRVTVTRKRYLNAIKKEKQRWKIEQSRTRARRRFKEEREPPVWWHGMDKQYPVQRFAVPKEDVRVLDELVAVSVAVSVAPAPAPASRPGGAEEQMVRDFQSRPLGDVLVKWLQLAYSNKPRRIPPNVVLPSLFNAFLKRHGSNLSPNMIQQLTVAFNEIVKEYTELDAYAAYFSKLTKRKMDELRRLQEEATRFTGKLPEKRTRRKPRSR